MPLRGLPGRVFRRRGCKGTFAESTVVLWKSSIPLGLVKLLGHIRRSHRKRQGELVHSEDAENAQARSMKDDRPAYFSRIFELASNDRKA